MIPEKVIWVQFPSRISTVHSKLLPINDLIFQFLIKHLTCYYKFYYRISDPETSSAMLYNFCNISSTLSIVYADLAILRKIPF